MSRLPTLLLLVVCSPALAAAPIVVLDPGHGGPKEGAVGAKGEKEKDLALVLALALEKQLERSGVRVLLTREADTDLDLKARTRIANDAGADLFVSIHLNSMPPRYRSRVHGIETFFLSAEASGERARQVAAVENAEAGEEAAPTDDLAFILNDLAETQAHHDASKLAYTVHQRLVADLGAADRGVQQAPFIVLMGAQMPAILAEVGFLSHPAEAARLCDKAYQKRIVASLAAGLLAFLAEVGGLDHAVEAKVEPRVEPKGAAPSAGALTDGPAAR